MAPRTFRISGFRGLLAVGLATTVFVLLVNIVLLIVSTRLPITETGAKLLFRGDCDYASSRSTIAHLGVNVLASLILSASNAAMQCLSAPTRADLDRAHPRGIWLDIGVSSLRNLFYSDRTRQAAWLGLLITSVPLHLVYNSVFLQTTQANAYNTMIVTEDFLQGAWTQPGSEGAIATETANGYYGVPSTIMQRIQAELHTYTKLSWDQCRSAYAVPLVNQWANLVVVTDVKDMQHSPSYSAVLASFWYPPSVSNITSNLFLSSGDYVAFDGYGTQGNTVLSVEGQLVSAVNWPPEGWHNLSGGVPSNDGHQEAVKMLYCFALPTTPVCTIELFQPFLEAVIVANVLKVLCFGWILFALPALAPLITFGDAVASFLARPDPLTVGGRAVDRNWVTHHKSQIMSCAKETGSLYRERQSRRDHWVMRSKKWINAPSGGQRFAVFAVYFFLIIFAAVFIHLGTQALQPEWYPDPNVVSNIQSIWNNGLGNVYPQEIIASTVTWSLGGSLLVANAPQLIMSVLFLFYNQIFTLMHVAAEAQAFYVKRDYLRVSYPRGQQRSSYWLGLPFKYAVPLMLVCAVLHWALSQTLFIAEINVVSPPGQSVSPPVINAVGYSIIGGIMVVGVAALMGIALLVFGFSRAFPTGMPLLCSNSIAISAACHGQEGSDSAFDYKSAEAEAESPLKFGVTAVTGEKRGRVGFSSGDVLPLEAQWIYGHPESPVTSISIDPKQDEPMGNGQRQFDV